MKDDDEQREHGAREPAAVAHRLHRRAVQPRHEQERHHRQAHQQRAPALVGHGAQDRVVGGEVPHRGDVLRGRQRVRRLKVRRLEEQAAQGRHEEHHDRQQDEEHPDAEDVLDRVVRMERDAVQGLAVRAHLLLDLDAIRVVRAGAAQRHQVQRHHQQQPERQRHDMQGEEAVERGIGDAVVAADPLDQPRPDGRYGAEQVHDHLRAPERHVAPGQHVAHERLGHQHQVHEHADQPQQLARLLVRAVQEGAEHVQVDDDEERRGAGGMQVADQPPVVDLAHDVFDRVERGQLAGLVEHRQEDARQQLQHQHHEGERAEEVPDVEVLRRVVTGQLVGDELIDRQALVDPGPQSLLRRRRIRRQCCRGATCTLDGHQAAPFPSLPTSERALVGVGVRRHPQVDRGRRALEHAPGEVEARAVARAEKTTGPARVQVAGGEALLGQAAQVRAGAHQHQELVAARAHRVLRVCGLVGPVRLGVLQVRVVPGDALDHVGRATHDINRRAAPYGGGHHARLELGDVHLGGCALGAGALGRGPGLDEGDHGKCRPDRPGGDRRPGQKLASAQVDLLVGDDCVIRHSNPLPVNCSPTTARSSASARASQAVAWTCAISYLAGGGALYTYEYPLLRRACAPRARDSRRLRCSTASAGASSSSPVRWSADSPLPS